MIKIFRVVTSNYCISTHLLNTIKRVPDGYRLYLIGDNVREYAYLNKSVIFIDLPIKRNFNLFVDLYCLFTLFYLSIKIRPQITHSIMAKAGFISSIAFFLARVPLRIHTFTGQIWATKTGIKKFLLIQIDKIICYLNSDCLTDSRSQSNFLFNNSIYKFNKPLKYILNGSISGVDLSRFDKINSSLKKDYKQKYKISENDFVIMYIARKSIDKGCLDMLKIFRTLNNSLTNIKFFFIGPDESGGQIDEFYLNNLSIKSSIIDLDFVNNHEVFLSLSNLLCLPSYREGFGTIIIDAGAASVPSIGYKIPGLMDSIVDNKTGFLIDLGDTDSFSEKIIDIYHDKTMLNTLKLNAFNYVDKNFNADQFNKELYKYYTTLFKLLKL